jgi:hypothetical protein
MAIVFSLLHSGHIGSEDHPARHSPAGYSVQSVKLITHIHLVPRLRILPDYWIFGLCPSSFILKKTTEHNVSEIGSI